MNKFKEGLKIIWDKLKHPIRSLKELWIQIKRFLKALWYYIKHPRQFYRDYRQYFTLKFLITFGIAWFITNGWAYMFVFYLGPALNSTLITGIGTTWIAFLFWPTSIEKPITFAIALFIHNKIFKFKDPKERSDVDAESI